MNPVEDVHVDAAHEKYREDVIAELRAEAVIVLVGKGAVFDARDGLGDFESGALEVGVHASGFAPARSEGELAGDVFCRFSSLGVELRGRREWTSVQYAQRLTCEARTKASSRTARGMPSSVARAMMVSVTAYCAREVPGMTERSWIRELFSVINPV